MAFSAKTFALTLLLAGTAVADDAKWPGGNLRNALKSHSPFAQHKPREASNDHPMRDAGAAVASAPAHKASSVQTVSHAGVVLMVTKEHLRKLEQNAIPSINKIIQENKDETNLLWKGAETNLKVEGADVTGFPSIRDIEVKTLSLEPSKDAEKHSHLHLLMTVGFKAGMGLKTRNLLKAKTSMSAREATFDLKVKVVGTSANSWTDKSVQVPQIELVSSDAKFKDLSFETVNPENLRSFSKQGLTGPMQTEHAAGQESNQQWLSAVGDEIKPRALKWLNEQMASLPNLAEVNMNDKNFNIKPSLVAVNAMQDGGLAIGADVNVADDECPEAHPDLPIDTLAGSQGGMRAFIAVRTLNCFLRHAHKTGLLAYEGTTGLLQHNLDSKQAVMLLQQATEVAKANGNPLEKVKVQTTSAPRCSSSPTDGLVCDLFFTLTLEQQSDRPTFDAVARVGLDVNLLENGGEAVLDPKVSRCKVDFDLKGDSVTKMGARMMFKGMAATLPPMACAIVPQLMKKVPKVHLGRDFLGSAVAFEDGYVSLKTDLNPFNLDVLGGSAEWGKLEGGFMGQ